MRVLLTKLPPLLKDILSEAIASESDLALASRAADVIVMQGTRDEAQALLHASQGARVIAIDQRGTRAVVLGGDEAVVLHDVSPTTIIMAIRGTA